MKRIFLIALLFLTPFLVSAQSVTGKWKTIDDDTGKPKSIVEIYEKNGLLYGEIIKLFREPHEVQDPICNECEDDRKGKKIIGMVILRDMKKDGSEWEDGTICDPKSGKIYDCELWIDDEDPNKLKVRGYILFLYRTQTWLRAD